MILSSTNKVLGAYLSTGLVIEKRTGGQGIHLVGHVLFILFNIQESEDDHRARHTFLLSEGGRKVSCTVCTVQRGVGGNP